jgi:hypothetical protein
MKIAPVETQRNTAAEIVTWLVGYSFDEASRWVVTIEDEQTRQNAFDRLATDWTTRAPDAAQRWAIGLPAGPDRDYMLNSMLSRLARDGYDIAIRPDIFDSFDSGALRDSAVESVVVNLARQDPDRAEAFISRVVTDRDLRRRAEAALEQYQL